jgi:hypothetical protein
MRIPRAAAVLLALGALCAGAAAAEAQSRCGGFLQPACPPPPPPPAPTGPVAATVTLTPATATKHLDSKRWAMFRGTVSGVDSPGGMVVDLHITVPGYGAGGTLETLVTQVDADGTFAFEVRPQISVDVRAVLREDGRATGSSALAHLTIRSRQNLSLRAISPTRGRFVLTTAGPRFVPLASGKVAIRTGKARFGFLYLVSKDGRSALRIGSGRVRNGACPSLCKRSAVGFFRVTPAIVREKRNFLACARGPMFVGIVDAAVSDACGKRRIALRKAG